MKSIKLVYLMLLGAFLLSGAPVPVPAEEAPPLQLSPEAAQVAQNFLFAFSRNERAIISGLLPKQLPNRYGPSPFMASQR